MDTVDDNGKGWKQFKMMFEAKTAMPLDSGRQ